MSNYTQTVTAETYVYDVEVKSQEEGKEWGKKKGAIDVLIVDGNVKSPNHRQWPLHAET